MMELHYGWKHAIGNVENGPTWRRRSRLSEITTLTDREISNFVTIP
jgi:hypothetical protein